MTATTGWVFKQTVLIEDAEYRLTVCEYEAIAEPDLYIEYADEDGDWCTQVPLPINAEKARAIAAGLVAWADSQVEPAPNRFDSVEISGIVEPIGEAKSCSK